MAILPMLIMKIAFLHLTYFFCLCVHCPQKLMEPVECSKLAASGILSQTVLCAFTGQTLISHIPNILTQKPHYLYFLYSRNNTKKQ